MLVARSAPSGGRNVKMSSGVLRHIPGISMRCGIRHIKHPVANDNGNRLLKQRFEVSIDFTFQRMPWMTAAGFRHCQRQSGLWRTLQVAKESHDFSLPPEIVIISHHCQKMVAQTYFSPFFGRNSHLAAVYQPFCCAGKGSRPRTSPCAGRDTTAPCTGPTAARDPRFTKKFMGM